MPKIPTRIATEKPKAPGSTRMSLLSGGISPQIPSVPQQRPVLTTPSTIDIQPFARAIQKIVVGLEKKDIDRRAYEEAMWVEKNTTGARKHWMAWMNEVSKSPKINLVDDMTDEFSEYSRSIIENAPSEQAHLAITKNLNSLYLSLMGQSMQIEARTQSQKTIIDLNDMVADASDMIASSNSPGVLYEEQARLRAIVDTAEDIGKISPEMAANFRQSVNNLAADAAEHIASTNPTEALKIIENAEGIDMRRRTSVIDKINRSKKTHNSLFAAEQESMLQDHLSKLERTGAGNPLFDMRVYSTARGEGNAFRAQKAINIATGLFEGRSFMRGKSLGEIDEVLNSFHPDSKENKSATFSKLSDDERVALHAALIREAQEQVKLMNNDPFTYSLQDPVVRERFNEAESAAEDVRVAMRLGAIEASLSFQESIGIVEGNRSVIPMDQARQIADRINNASPDEVQNEFISLSNIYGRYYPDVFRDLSRLPDNERISSSLQIVALHLGKPWIADFIKANRIPDKEFGLEREKMTDIDSKLFGNKELQSFKSSMINSNPDLIGTANDYQESVRKFAMLLLSRGSETSASKATERAIDAIINSEYDFGEANDQVYAIKKRYTNERGTESVFTEDEIKQVEKGLNITLGRGFMGKRFIEASKMSVDNLDWSVLYLPAQMREEDQRAAAQRSLKNMAFWATSPENDGVILYLPGLSGTAQPWLDRNGREVKITFVEAMEMGQAFQRNQQGTGGRGKDLLGRSFSERGGISLGP